MTDSTSGQAPELPRTTEHLARVEHVVASAFQGLPAEEMVLAHKTVPSFHNPMDQWAREAAMAAIEQGAPLWPESIYAAGLRANLETPPSTRGAPIAWLWALRTDCPPPAMFWGLVAEFGQALVRERIAVFGRALADNAPKGDLLDQIASLEGCVPIIQLCRELIADAG